MPPDPEIDWTELSPDGRELEQLTRDLLGALGYRHAWSGQGPDRGRDLTAEEPGVPEFGGFARKWLVSCKHKARSGTAVGYDDVGDVPGRLNQHGCQGFLLVCTTHPSAALITTFRAWEDNSSHVFHYWDEPTLRLLLRRPEAAPVRSTYFPVVSGASGSAALGAVKAPDFARLRSVPTAREHLSYIEGEEIGFYFETQARDPLDDGSSHHAEFELAWEHLHAEISHLLWGLRGVFYDGKHSAYSWRVDVATPSSDQELDTGVLQDRLSRVLVRRGGWGGKWHDFDIRRRERGPVAMVTPRSPEEARLSLLDSWRQYL